MSARLLCLFAGAWALAAPFASAADPPEILEAKLSEALDAALGPGKASVFIRALGPKAGRSEAPPTAEASAAPSRETALWEGMVRRMKSAPPVLPGYRVPSDLRAEALRSLKDELRASAGGEHRSGPGTASPLAISLYLDADAGPRAEEIARETAAAVLRLDPARGDEVRVSFSPRPAPRAEVSAPRAPPASTARSLALYSGPAALLLALGALFLPFALTLSRRPPVLPAPAPVPPPAVPKRARRPWLSLSRPGQAAAAVRALMTEPAETCVEALRSMVPDSASEVYRRLPSHLRSAVARSLLLPRSPGAGEDVLERLAADMEAYEAGEGLLASLLLRVMEPERDRILESLSREFPSEVLRLRREIPTLEDVSSADVPSLRTCLSPFSCDELALCLYELPDDLRSRILSALPKTVQAMVQERSRFLVPESSELVSSARAEVVSRWRRLELCGRVRPLHGARA